MAKVTVTSAGVQILDGTQTVNTLVKVGSKQVWFGTNTIGARQLDDLIDLGAGDAIILPPGKIVTFFCAPNENYAIIKTEDFGV